MFGNLLTVSRDFTSLELNPHATFCKILVKLEAPPEMVEWVKACEHSAKSAWDAFPTSHWMRWMLRALSANQDDLPTGKAYEGPTWPAWRDFLTQARAVTAKQIRDAVPWEMVQSALERVADQIKEGELNDLYGR